MSIARTRLVQSSLPRPAICRHQYHATPIGRLSATSPPPWRSSTTLDEWVQKEANPISLRQLTVFGRVLTEARLLSSANYVRAELPTRIAHRLRDLQTIPYAALANKHIKSVYELYYQAFDRLRQASEIKTLADNDAFCDLIRMSLSEHLSVIPSLARGIIEIQDTIPAETCDRLMNTLLRSRISRRVIAEQHLALTETFHEPWHFPNAPKTRQVDPADDFVGEIFLKCNAAEIIRSCAETTRTLCSKSYASGTAMPEIKLSGHLDTTFPYIPSHLEYMVSELLRNSIQAVVEHHHGSSTPPPIEVVISGAAQHVIIRVSDRGGGVPAEILPYLWSFVKGPRRQTRLQNLSQISALAGTMHEVRHVSPQKQDDKQMPGARHEVGEQFGGSLDALTARSPDLRLGIGLPMSRIYAEYWAGSLEVHSLEGYGTDAFLQVSRLGNKNETLSTRATMDAL